jgi:hypothetical protein
MLTYLPALLDDYLAGNAEQADYRGDELDEDNASVESDARYAIHAVSSIVALYR